MSGFRRLRDRLGAGNRPSMHFQRHPMGHFAILGAARPPSIAVLRHRVLRRTVIPYGKKGVSPNGSALNVFPYGEKGGCPDGRALDVFTYGKKEVCPNGSALDVFTYGEMAVWPDESVLKTPQT